MTASIPLVDLRDRGAASAVDRACREHGFFCVTGHGVAEDLAARLDTLARQFFALPEDEKAMVSMDRAGRAWRGWFPVGGELTSGTPDRKEGLYVGEEHPEQHPRVVAGVPLHGANLFPRCPADLGPVVMEWMAAMSALGHRIMRVLAAGLGLPTDHFDTQLLQEPTVLFRIFHYPPGDDESWGVGEHTDYGLLTILMQDDCGGLQVHAPSGWIDIEPMPGTFVCNIGDMLEKMTGGRYRSTPHRVRNTSGRDRLSYPFFFDPGWDAHIAPLPLRAEAVEPGHHRWDGADVLRWEGLYGDYLLGKVAKVFPELHRQLADPQLADPQMADPQMGGST